MACVKTDRNTQWQRNPGDQRGLDFSVFVSSGLSDLSQTRTARCNAKSKQL
jgi:hypothetical protein